MCLGWGVCSWARSSSVWLLALACGVWRASCWVGGVSCAGSDAPAMVIGDVGGVVVCSGRIRGCVAMGVGDSVSAPNAGRCAFKGWLPSARTICDIMVAKPSDSCVCTTDRSSCRVSLCICSALPRFSSSLVSRASSWSVLLGGTWGGPLLHALTGVSVTCSTGRSVWPGDGPPGGGPLPVPLVDGRVGCGAVGGVTVL